MRLATVLIGAVTFAADLASKALVKNSPRLWDYPVVEDLLTIEYVKNRGVAFGFLDKLDSAWKTPCLSALAVAAVVFVLYYVWTTPANEKTTFVALGLLLGGITGNFVDRLQDGAVDDFVKVHWGTSFAWPTFNVADSAITCGVFLVLVSTWMAARRQMKAKDEGGDEAE
jgi:signal peptidase II